MGRKKKLADESEDWGNYMNQKKQKLESQFRENAPVEKSTSESNLFAGISIFVNGYTEPSACELKRLMMIHGGVFYHYYSKNKCTYIIASNLAQSKINALRDEKILNPKWITDSIEYGSLRPIDSYLLYRNNGVNKSSIFKPAKPASSFDNQAGPSHRSNTSADDNFLNEFYNNSRLHHISNAGAQFKQYVAQLQDRDIQNFPGLDKLKAQCSQDGAAWDLNKPLIMHLDMDCFFVSVGLRNFPDLVGQPVAVSHSTGQAPKPRQGTDLSFEHKYFSKKEILHGELKKEYSMAEIASCNYEARKYGLKNGMFLGPALELCPNLKLIPYDFESYKTVSYSLYDLVASYTSCIEAVSCDEMFIDCTQIVHDTCMSPCAFADHIRSQVLSITKCNCSAGLGANMLLARLATRKAKPNGSYYIHPDQQSAFMSDVNVRHLPGIGRSLESRLTALNVTTCSDLQAIPLHVLRKQFGHKTADNLHNYSRGICNKKLQYHHQRKSVSAEINYGIRFQKHEEAVKFLKELSNEVSKRLKAINAKGKAITLKLKIRSADAPVETAKFLGHGICDNATRSVSLPEYTDSSDVIFKHCASLLKAINAAHEDLRGVGIQVNKLNNKSSESRADDFFNQNTVDKMFKKLSTMKNNCNKSVKDFKDFIPSQLSQVDESVLDQLPGDVQGQVVRALQSKTKSPLESCAPQTSTDASTPQCSSNLPDLSAIDQSVFTVLPADIQEELRAAYSRQMSETLNSMPTNRKFKAKNSSPSKYRKNKSPSKHLTKKYKSSPDKNRKITDHLFAPKVKDGQSDERRRHSFVDEEKNADPGSFINERQVEFCGFSSLKDVKNVINEWICTSKDPVGEDVQLLSNYLTSLARSRDLEKVDLLLKHLHRKFSGMNAKWQLAYFSIVDNVQISVQKCYGCKLQVNMQF